MSEAQLERVMGYVEAGRAEGARLVTGGERTDVDGKGNFVTATVFADVEPAMTIAREEIFGPVAAVMPFEDVDDALAKANDTMYGLAAAVWTRELSLAHEFAARVRAGTVWVNCYDVFDAAAPFGGFKMSGYGRELGEEGLKAYTESKTVTIAL